MKCRYFCVVFVDFALFNKLKVKIKGRCKRDGIRTWTERTDGYCTIGAVVERCDCYAGSILVQIKYFYDLHLVVPDLFLVSFLLFACVTLNVLNAPTIQK